MPWPAVLLLLILVIAILYGGLAVNPLILVLLVVIALLASGTRSYWGRW